MEHLRGLSKQVLFPGLLLSVLAADFVLWYLGFSPSDWIEYTYDGAAVALLVLESVLPRNSRWRYWNENGIQIREILVEIGFFFWGGWFAGAVTYAFSRWAAAGLRGSLGLSNTIGLPLVVQAVMMILLIDFSRYWMHRWMHENPLLWRFHALHHVPERLGAISSTRTHPVDDFLLYVPEMIVLFTLGFDRTLVAVLYSVIWVISLAKHTNVEMQANVFSRHFQIPRYHLIHHECHDGTAPTKNFSEILTIWDRVFGSFDGRKVGLDHRVGVATQKRRGVTREFLGWAYLRTKNL